MPFTCTLVWDECKREQTPPARSEVYDKLNGVTAIRRKLLTLYREKKKLYTRTSLKKMMNKHPTVGDVTFRTAQRFQRSTKAVQHAAPVIPFLRVRASVYRKTDETTAPARHL